MDIMEGIGTGAEGEPKITVRELMEAVDMKTSATVEFSRGSNSQFSYGLVAGEFSAIFAIMMFLGIVTASQYANFYYEQCFDDSGVI